MSLLQQSGMIPLYLLPAGLAFWMILNTVRNLRRDKNLPPGPSRLPILGNLTVFPREWPHYRFTEWGACLFYPMPVSWGELSLGYLQQQPNNMEPYSRSKSWTVHLSSSIRQLQ
jgi:hypothetical protein